MAILTDGIGKNGCKIKRQLASLSKISAMSPPAVKKSRVGRVHPVFYPDDTGRQVLRHFFVYPPAGKRDRCGLYSRARRARTAADIRLYEKAERGCGGRL